MFKLSQANILERKADLSNIPEGKKLINTINAYSYNMALKDELFAEALNKGDALIPDGGSIVWTCHLIKSLSTPQERCAGWDLFAYEMNKLNTEKKTPVEGRTRPVVMFLGSSEKVLALICKNAAKEYPNLDVVTYSPPYKPEFSEEDSKAMVDAINAANPDLMWIGMTAPKQEKWIMKWKDKMPNVDIWMALGATIDFEAGTLKRAPMLYRKIGMEWLYRFFKEPKRLFRRYLVDDTKFFWYFGKQLLGVYRNPFE